MEREIGNFYIEGYNFDTKTYDNKDNTLLLVIDLQEKLMPAIYESDRIIKNSACLLKVFEMYGIKKIATEQYPKGLGQSVDEIKENLDDEYIFSKTSFDAITDEVSSYLKENKITNVIITGAETHICVYQTVRRLLFEGYKVFVVEDAVSSFNKESCIYLQLQCLLVQKPLLTALLYPQNYVLPIFYKYFVQQWQLRSHHIVSHPYHRQG